MGEEINTIDITDTLDIDNNNNYHDINDNYYNMNNNYHDIDDNYNNMNGNYDNINYNTNGNYDNLINNYFNKLDNDDFIHETDNNQYYAYLKSLYDTNNFELQQDLNAYQNKFGEEEQREIENDELYKLRLETIKDLENLKKNRNEIMYTDHNEEFITLYNNNNTYNNYLYFIIVIIIIVFLFF